MSQGRLECGLELKKEGQDRRFECKSMSSNMTYLVAQEQDLGQGREAK